MIIRLRPRQAVEAAWKAWEGERTRALRAAESPSVIGGTDAAALLDRREFMFRGRPYRVPPVPWPLAAKILELQDQFRRSKGATFEETIERFQIAVDMTKAACHPAGWIRRLFWPITPNPFRNATPTEVGELLGFLLSFLAFDRSADLSSNRPPRVPGTSAPISPASSRASRGGRARTAIRSPGGTS